MSEGKQKRDFVYIDDLIEALVKFLQVDCNGQIIEIGSGKAVKLIKLPNYMKNLALYHFAVSKIKVFRFKTNKTKIRKGEVHKIQANLKNAKNILNWKPKINLKEGLKRTLEWWCKQ